MSGWFKNLKKWQRGGLIGCAVAVLLLCLITFTPNNVFILMQLHFFFLAIGLFSPSISDSMAYFAGAGVIVVFYGGLGAIVGKIHQGTNPVGKWLLTGLLLIFLFLFYFFNFIATTWLAP